MATPKLSEAACKGTHLPDDDGSDENFVYGGLENADGPAVRTGAWIADVTYDEPSSAPPFGQPVTFTATVSNSEPVTHAGWDPWEDNPSLSEDLGIAAGDGGTVITELMTSCSKISRCRVSAAATLRRRRNRGRQLRWLRKYRSSCPSRGGQPGSLADQH